MNKKILIIILSIILLIILIIWLIFSNYLYSEKETTDIKKEDNMNINMIINDVPYKVTLFDNPTTSYLLDLLPLEITMHELNGNEKYYYFNETLPSNPTNVTTIKAGDIMLYNDNCLVIFYEDFQTSYRYTKIGEITNPTNLKEVVKDGDIKVLIEKSV